MRPGAQMSRTCTIRPSVRRSLRVTRTLKYKLYTAKKEDDPEQALKAFRAIVEQEGEKGDW